MLYFSEPRPVAPMTLAEARRIISDAAHGAGFDPNTRAVAWAMCLAARRGQRNPVVMLIAIGGPDQTETPEPPKDAA